MALMSLWFQTKSLRSSFFSVKKKNGTFHPYFLCQSNIDHCGPFECFYKSNNHVIAIKILTTPFFPFLSLLIYVLHYLVLLKPQNTAITYLNSFLLEIPVLVNRVCSFDLRTIRTPNHTFQLLVLISKSVQSNWTVKQSSFKFGIQPDRNGSVPSHHRTTVVRTGLSLCTM